MKDRKHKGGATTGVEAVEFLDMNLIGHGVAGVLPTKRKKDGHKDKSVKKRRRRREMLHERKLLDSSERKVERKKLMERVASRNLSLEQLKLFQSSSELGVKKDTLRNRLRREFNRSKADLPAGEDAHLLLVERSVPSEEEADSVEEDNDGAFEDVSVQETDVAEVETVDRNRNDGVEVQTECAINDAISPKEPIPPVEIIRTTRKRERKLGKMNVSAARALVGGQTEEVEEPSSMTVQDVVKLLEAEAQSSLEAEKSSEDEDSEDEDDVGGDEGVDGGDESKEEVKRELLNKREEDVETLGRNDAHPKAKVELRKLVVRVDRPPEIAKKRMELPVCEKEHEIMQAVSEEDVVVVIGATGTGKTTQVPQFLYEAGFGDPKNEQHSGIVAVTQPRRVAVMSCSSRVAEELGVELGTAVGFQIRHHSKLSCETKIKFATDGILLREVEEDLLLRRYSAVIVDEAHERSIDTDLLLTLLSRSVAIRRDKGHAEGLPPLKVIIMSATLDVDGLFAGEKPLFSSYRMIDVAARQFPVTVHFSRKTADNYTEEAFKKVVRIHNRLPSGGVLVFMTGKKEVEDLCDRLRKSFGKANNAVVLPLYAMLPEKQQRKVFQPTKNARRKIVVATNVAETSITIPDIVYVVDSGRAKEKVFHRKGLLSSFEVGWISKTSAKQREGRAGRTSAGHCYRLYSSAVFQNEFKDTPDPEVSRVPVDALVLRLKSMGIVDVKSFPLPTRPSDEVLAEAITLLQNLGAIDENGVTGTGEALALLPIPPRFGKMMLVAAQGNCLRYAARMAAALNVGELLQRGVVHLAKIHSTFSHEKSEILSLLRIVCAAEHAVKNQGEALGEFCGRFGLQEKNVRESLATSQQLEEIYRKYCGGVEDSYSSVLLPPTEDQETVLLQAILAAFPDQIARRLHFAEAAAMGIKVKKSMKAFQAPFIDDSAVYLPASSMLSDDTDYVCFSELVQFKREATAEEEEQVVMRICGASLAKRRWIASRCESICSFGAALERPKPYYDVKRAMVMCYVVATYGPGAYPLGTVPVEFTDRIRDNRVPMSRFKVFAKSLVEGQVIPALAQYGDPSGHNDMHGSANHLDLIAKELAVCRISSKIALTQKWTYEPRYLLQQFRYGLAETLQEELQKVWPPCNTSSGDAEQR